MNYKDTALATVAKLYVLNLDDTETAYDLIYPKLDRSAWESVARDIAAEEEDFDHESEEDFDAYWERITTHDAFMLIFPKLSYDDWESVGRDLIAIGVIEVNDEGDEYVVNA